MHNYEILAPNDDERAKLAHDISRLKLEERVNVFHPKQQHDSPHIEVNYLIAYDKKQHHACQGPALRIYINETLPDICIKGAQQVSYSLAPKKVFGAFIIEDALVGIYPLWLLTEHEADARVGNSETDGQQTKP